MMSTIHQLNDMNNRQINGGVEKPACCIGAARGHCTVHCPRIEDVLYSQRKGKTNKGAQRWRCKACGTKWTSKGIILQPPVVPDSTNSIGFGNGPEEISMEQLRNNNMNINMGMGLNSINSMMNSSNSNNNNINGNSSNNIVIVNGASRPYKKTKTGDSVIPTSPFGSTSNLFGNSNNNNNERNNSNMSMNNINNSNGSSPIPSPPSPISFLQRNSNVFVPILPTNNNNNNNNNNSSNNSNNNNNQQLMNPLRTSSSSTSQALLGSQPLSNLQQQQGRSSLSTSQKSTQSLNSSGTTKPVLVGMPMQLTSNAVPNSPNKPPSLSQSLSSQNLLSYSNNGNQQSISPQSSFQQQPPSPTNNNNNNMNNSSNNINMNNMNTVANGVPRPSLSTSRLQSKPPSPQPLQIQQQQQRSSNNNNGYQDLRSPKSNNNNNNNINTPIHSVYGQSTPPPTKAPVSSKAPAVYHNVRIPLNSTDSYNQYYHQQQQFNQQQYYNNNNNNNNHYNNQTTTTTTNSTLTNSRHNDLLSPTDSQIWAPIQYSWIQTQFNPSSSLLESLKRLINSIVVFSNELNVEHRLKLVNFLNTLSSPSSESQYNTSASKTMLSCIDSNIFNVTRHYQLLYQTISKHYSMMEDSFVPLTEVYFDENEINKFIQFSDQFKFIEEQFEFILRELSNIRDVFIMKRENIEKNIIESSKIIQQTNSTTTTTTSSSNSGNGPSNINLEQAKQDTTRLLDTLAPLETTLNAMESKFKSVQKEISMVIRVFSFFELMYNIHITCHQAIVEKHSKQLSNYMVDVIQQSLYNCDVISVAYNKIKTSLNIIDNNDGDDQQSQHQQLQLIDTSNPFINKLSDLLSKYENIKNGGSGSYTSSPNTNSNIQQQIQPINSYQPPKERKVMAIYHTTCLDHLVPEDHPESPKRLASVIRAINEFSRQSDRLIIKNDPEEISDKWILTVHSPEYLKLLDELTEKLDTNEIRPLNVNNDGAQTGINQFTNTSGNNSTITTTPTTTSTSVQQSSVDCEDGDTFVSKLSLRAAKRSSGATIEAIDNVMKGKVTSAFVAARPPGHHAGRDGLTSGTSSQGFCLLNHVCIGAKYAQLKYNLEKIAIIDFDVHHGNGTEEILANDNGFYFLSIHMFEEGFYPGSGGGSGSIGVVNLNQDNNNDVQIDNNSNQNESSNIVNIPLDPKSSASSFLKAFSIIVDKLNDYQPELILISCGFDAHMEDHLASLCLLEENYAEITRSLRKVADRWCKGRLVSVLEGGYNINALRQCTIAHLSALSEDD